MMGEAEEELEEEELEEEEEEEQEQGTIATSLTTATPTVTSTISNAHPQRCMNGKCCTTSSSAWKPGWLLRSGRIADLCEACGLAFEHLYFCETFHGDESGWRTCNSCQKRVHCGCIASISVYILLDSGGVECVDCARNNNSYVASNSGLHHAAFSGALQKIEGPKYEEWTQDMKTNLSWNPESGSIVPLSVPWLASAAPPGVVQWQDMPEAERGLESDHLGDQSAEEPISATDLHVKGEDDTDDKIAPEGRAGKLKISAHSASSVVLKGEQAEDVMNNHPVLDNNVLSVPDPGATKEGYAEEESLKTEGDEDGGVDTSRLSFQITNGEEPESLHSFMDSKGLHDSGNVHLDPPNSTCLTMSLAICPTKEVPNEVCEQTGFKNSMTNAAEPNGAARDSNKFSGPTITGQRQKQIVVKPPHAQGSNRTEAAKDSSSLVPVRIARPPGEGRGRNQLLPRYWPRITDQELQQITSGDSNSTITPLFEKMLSASDAGRIGRLVLPKACAEAYFPAISQPEGLPLKIQDVTGKDWAFQFRFWPNNNSRMYVLEGVTPCIQAMQLQAGDTVTFSRLDPEGKLIMGYRRAPTSMTAQDPQNLNVGTPTIAAVPLNSSCTDIVSVANLPGVMPHLAKGSLEAHTNGLSGALNVSDTGYGWYYPEKQATKPKESSFSQPVSSSDRKRGRHLGPKNKRSRLEVEDSIDQFNISWEEVQELLRPPPNVVPSIVTVDGHEFEEYEEPPVFGKRTFFLSRQGRPGEEQWAQCDDCGTWRKVPADVFLPTRWTCADNVWDPKRDSCTAPQDFEMEEIDNGLWLSKDVKKQEVAETPSGLEALANAATLGESNMSSQSPAPTTKHPRHRPGCTCIVCIQPPSGKGPKHKPTCTCNVCMTVKRRFKTLMMRRKKRLSERESENVRKKRVWPKEEGEVNSGIKSHSESYTTPENESVNGNVTTTFPALLPRVSNFSSNGNRFTPSTNITGSNTPRPRSVIEEHMIGKASIDLNSQPERDPDSCKGTGPVSMMMLFQSANYPLERYLQQQGISNLSCTNQMMNPTMPFPGNLGSTRTDGLTGSQSGLLNSERTLEDQHLGFSNAKVDNTTISSQIGSLQSLDLIEHKPTFQVSSQSS